MDDRTALLLVGVVVTAGALVTFILAWVRMRRQDRDRDGHDRD